MVQIGIVVFAFLFELALVREPVSTMQFTPIQITAILEVHFLTCNILGVCVYILLCALCINWGVTCIHYRSY